MIYRLVVPTFGELEEIRLLQWAKVPGDAVADGELLVELETDKALVEVRAGQPGYLRRVECPDGEWYRLGELLGVLTTSVDEEVPSDLDAQPLLATQFEIV